MSVIDDLVANNVAFARNFDGASASVVPAKKVIVLTCMDSRLDPVSVLGLVPGDAHVLRNAGGIASEDAIRSIMLSQRRLGTTSIMVIHHSDCGMLSLDEQTVNEQIEVETGVRAPVLARGVRRPRRRRAGHGRQHPREPVHPLQGRHQRLRLRGRHGATPRGQLRNERAYAEPTSRRLNPTRPTAISPAAQRLSTTRGTALNGWAGTAGVCSSGERSRNHCGRSSSTPRSPIT